MKIAFDVDVLAKQMDINRMVHQVADWGYKYIEQSPHPRINPFYKHPLFSKECEQEYRQALRETGVEISGGEAQKLALARALYKNAPFIVLDEPTAALDPIAEYEIYSKFNRLVGDKTAIYISHRLSSCRFCKHIAVFQQGELVQLGTHEELIRDPSSAYYELWNAQAQYYC